MDPLRIFRRIRSIFDRENEASALREEMQLHIELRARKLAQSGVDPLDAGFAARRRFGNAAVYQDQISDLWGWTMWERLFQDLRHAARSLLHAPGISAIAIVTLALGLGINTAIFSAVDAVMLRPLPYAHPERLVALYEMNTRPEDPNATFNSRGVISGPTDARRTTVSVANIADYDRAGLFQSLASYDLAFMNFSGMDAPERLQAEPVTWNLFRVLGVTPAIGRDFAPDEDGPGAPLTTVISYAFWQRRLGGAPDAVGRSIMLDGRLYRVIGVLPRGFQSPLEMALAEPVSVYVAASYPASLFASRGDHEVNVVARLKPGVTVAEAQAALKTVSANLARQYPPSNADIFAAIAPLRDDLAGNVRNPLWSLLFASGLIVLTACVNVANLTMVRAAARRHESSVRMALGAGRARLMRQLIAESLLLAGAGCVAALLLGRLLILGLTAIAPPGIPRIETAGLDWRVFAAASAVAALTGLVFGLASAWHASQVRPIDALRSAGRGSGSAAQARWRMGLTVAEIALSLILLVGATLLLRSFGVLMGVQLGFQPDHVVAMNINLPLAGYADGAARLRFFQQLEERVRALPGVESAAYANNLPMRGGWRSGVLVDGDPSRQATIDFQAVSPTYFRTLGIPLLRGRIFDGRDSADGPPVAIVNQAYARQFLGGQDPLGHIVQRTEKIAIVGVVNDIRRAGKAGAINPEVYLCATQTRLYPVRLADFAVRTAGDPRTLVNAISRQVWSIDKNQPVGNVRTMDEIIDLSVSQRRFQTLLLAIFASVAVLLAVVGIYGVLSYAVGQRTAEFGIRVALGAAPRTISVLVLRQAIALIAAGIILGVAGALALTRFLETLLFEVKATDWRAYAAAAGLLVAMALIAALIPALRGARLEPMRALRQE